MLENHANENVVTQLVTDQKYSLKRAPQTNPPDFRISHQDNKEVRD